MPLQYPPQSPYNPYTGRPKKPRNWSKIIMILIGILILIIVSVVVYTYINGRARAGNIDNNVQDEINNLFNNYPNNTGSSGESVICMLKSGMGFCDCGRDLYNCNNFARQVDAQIAFNYCSQQGKGDIHQLDADGNGEACENLP